MSLSFCQRDHVRRIVLAPVTMVTSQLTTFALRPFVSFIFFTTKSHSHFLFTFVCYACARSIWYLARIRSRFLFHFKIDFHANRLLCRINTFTIITINKLITAFVLFNLFSFLWTFRISIAQSLIVRTDDRQTRRPPLTKRYLSACIFVFLFFFHPVGFDWCAPNPWSYRPFHSIHRLLRPRRSGLVCPSHSIQTLVRWIETDFFATFIRFDSPVTAHFDPLSVRSIGRPKVSHVAIGWSDTIINRHRFSNKSFLRSFVRCPVVRSEHTVPQEHRHRQTDSSAEFRLNRKS